MEPVFERKYIHYIEEGELLELTGGVHVYTKCMEPSLGSRFGRYVSRKDKVSIERYLGSGAIKGVGPSLAGRIVKKFGGDTFRIIRRRTGASGRGKRNQRAESQRDCHSGRRKKGYEGSHDISAKYGISTTLAARIYQHYGQSVYRVIEEIHIRWQIMCRELALRRPMRLRRRSGYTQIPIIVSEVVFSIH